MNLGRDVDDRATIETYDIIRVGRLRMSDEVRSVRSDVIGHLDRIEDGHVIGWALDPAQPSNPVHLQVLVDGETVVEGYADAYRSDLLELGVRDGRCAYFFELPIVVLDDCDHVVDVVVASSGERLVAPTRTFRLEPTGSERQRRIDILFDAGRYIITAKSKGLDRVADAYDHYRRTGWRRGIDPHPIFDVTRYARREHLERDTEPLVHFVTEGCRTGASINALFEHPPTIDIKGRSEHAVFAYLERRLPDGSEPSTFFSDREYSDRNPGVVEAGFLPLVHYLAHGRFEGRRPHRDFDPRLFATLAELDLKRDPYGAFVDWLKEREPFQRPPTPRLSIVILNLDKALLTLQCLFFLERHTDLRDVEIVVVDNGSRDEDFALLCRWATGVEIVRLGVNRGFGEGNNIGVEHCRGEAIAFLNNDTFVLSGWLPPLLDALKTDATIGAVGAKLLYPNGSLQEAGATISACGTAVQRGKHLDPRLPLFNTNDVVDYCSAALLLVRTTAFRAVLGFDLCWDPAYYEDSDLCLKLRTIGLKTLYVPRSEAVHIEHATSADADINARLRHIVSTNRLKFVARWTQNPRPVFRSDPELVARRKPRSAAASGALALYTPYPLTPGGGERYLLTIAATYGRGRTCVLFTPERSSRFRLLTLARELDLDLAHVELAKIDEVQAFDRFDVFVCMGNEVLPPIAAIARRNLFHCQFPFPMAPGHLAGRWHLLDGYDDVIVNSVFTADHYRSGLEKLGLAAKHVAVLPPPVPHYGNVKDAASPVALPRACRILSVGRFAPGGHCKRQDAMIAAFRRLRDSVELPLELHLAGAVGSDPDARDYVQGLVEKCRDLPVRLHLNPSALQVSDLYAHADLYWHLTGLGRDLATTPELFEHFGIALCEAMSAGIVPIALRGAGPSEIITNGVDGYLIDGVDDLIACSTSFLSDPNELARMGTAAARRAADFSQELFARHFERMAKHPLHGTQVDTTAIAAQ